MKEIFTLSSVDLGDPYLDVQLQRRSHSFVIRRGTPNEILSLVVSKMTGEVTYF